MCGVPPRSNISFKRDTPCRGISRSWVSSRQARCSGLMVGVPLNLTLDITKKNIIFQCVGSIQKHEVASRVMSVAPKRQASVSVVAPFGIKHFSGLLSVCATHRVRVMGVLQPSMSPSPSGVIPALRDASRESAKGIHALTVNARYG